MKTNELTGAALDWAVVKCEGEVGRIELEQVNGVWAVAVPELGCYYEPSTDWGQGGPIVEREKITVGPARFHSGEFFAHTKFGNEWFGPTPLIASMRCDGVDVPEELTK